MIDKAIKYYSNRAHPPLTPPEFAAKFPMGDLAQAEIDRLNKAFVVCKDGVVRTR